MSEATTETTRRRNPETVAMDQIDRILTGLGDENAELRVMAWVMTSRFPQCKFTMDSNPDAPKE
jgi:hypothetical protein